MNEQDGAQSETKQRRSRTTKTAEQENGKRVPATQRPPNHDIEAWKAYWRSQGQPWRHEPEIDAERQKYLAERQSITPNVQRGTYPFKDIKLNRADVEWLLATHENGRGPIDWTDESQRPREGLDLRGANLAQVDLSRLPLTRTHAGLSWDEWEKATAEQRDMAAAHLEHAHLVCKIRIGKKQGGGLKSGINEVSSTVSKELWRQRGCSDIWNDQPFTF